MDKIKFTPDVLPHETKDKVIIVRGVSSDFDDEKPPLDPTVEVYFSLYIYDPDKCGLQYNTTGVKVLTDCHKKWFSKPADVNKHELTKLHRFSLGDKERIIKTVRAWVGNDMKNIDDIIGETQAFYGVNMNEIELGNVVWEAVEDPDDGYRSCLDCVVVKRLVNKKKRKLFAYLTVCKAKAADFEGYELVDPMTRHVWLMFGTDHSDSYYPCFTFMYSPPKTPVVSLV